MERRKALVSNRYEVYEKILMLADQDLNCNTSYPIKPELFSEFKSTSDIMEDVSELSMYFHIPFCRNLCTFCEYTRFKSGNDEIERHYLHMLNAQLKDFLRQHPVRLLYGLDVGGGTPTALNESNFLYLMQIIKRAKSGISQIADFESSIEFSFHTISENKIQAIKDAGFTRVSSGLQILDADVLKMNHRADVSLEHVLMVMEMLKKNRISKRNLDLMYGLPNQTLTMCENTMRAIELIMPEHVTLYETRYNMNAIKDKIHTRQSMYEQYSFFYRALIALGYKGIFGQNTFTLCDDDGISSYLKYRMFSGISYKGFGISAQSMSRKGISYNVLKNCRNNEMPNIAEITEEDIYELPAEEVIAKYVCISLYSGRIYLDFLYSLAKEKRLRERYLDVISFLEMKQYIQMKQNVCYLTELGFLHYGAVAALFWSNNHLKHYFRDRLDTAVK